MPQGGSGGYPRPKPKPKPTSHHVVPQSSHPKPGPPPRDAFTPYERGSTNTARDQALAIVEQFLQIMGWPAGVDVRKLELGLLKHGLELSSAQAYNWLFGQVSKKIQHANPNAEFGMTRDAYVTALNGMKDIYESLTGSSDMPHEILRMAIDQQWTQTELSQFLANDKRYSNPAALPWLQQGLTFREIHNQFYQTYGHNPSDPHVLASWFNFRTGAAQIGSGGLASVQAGQGPAKPPSSTQTEIR